MEHLTRLEQGPTLALTASLTLWHTANQDITSALN